MRDNARTVGNRVVVATFVAVAAYTYVDAEGARMALAASLRHQAATASGKLDWSTLTVEGPTETPGARGRSSFEWTATVSTMRSP